MIIILLLSSLMAYAQSPLHWSHILEVSDRHEFYQNHENIEKPRDAWQTLFGLIYLDSEFKKLKDCVFLKVPGSDPGILKIKTISAYSKCDTSLLEEGSKEVSGIKSVKFAIYEKEAYLDLTLTDFKSQKWEASLQSSFKKPEPKMQMSSTELRAPKMIFLAPVSNIQVKDEKKPFLKDKTLCHDINEDCQEVSPSICSDCSGGWYEIPNGCSSGPKYCGQHVCGSKDQPACRRGMKWQKKSSEFDCRTDSSFAYCSKGLKVVCEGKKAFCR